MAESILVTGKKISSMELVTNVTGNEKIPTGQPDDLALTPNQIADHTISRGDLASQEDLSQVEVELGSQITSSNNSIRGLIAAEEAARIAADNLKVDKEGSVSSVAGRVGDVVLAPSDVLVEGFGSQEDVNSYVPKPFLSGYTYGLGERVVLNSGEEVKSSIEGNVGDPNISMVGWVSVVSDSLSATVQTFNTPDAGVDAVTGVADGAYFNVRSLNDEYYADEYQNVAGVPTPSGKSYPSSAALNNISHNNLKYRNAADAHPASAILDASGKNQQEINNNQSTFKSRFIFPQDAGALGSDSAATVADWTILGSSLYYPNLAAIQVDYPHVVSLSDTIDWAATQKVINDLSDNGGGTVNIPAGIYITNRPLEMKPFVNVIGATENVIIKKIADTANSAGKNCILYGYLNRRTTISGLTLRGNRTNYAAGNICSMDGLIFSSANYMGITNIRVEDCRLGYVFESCWLITMSSTIAARCNSYGVTLTAANTSFVISNHTNWGTGGGYNIQSAQYTTIISAANDHIDYGGLPDDPFLPEGSGGDHKNPNFLFRVIGSQVSIISPGMENSATQYMYCEGSNVSINNPAVYTTTCHADTFRYIQIRGTAKSTVNVIGADRLYNVTLAAGVTAAFNRNMIYLERAGYSRQTFAADTLPDDSVFGQYTVAQGTTLGASATDEPSVTCPQAIVYADINQSNMWIGGGSPFISTGTAPTASVILEDGVKKLSLAGDASLHRIPLRGRGGLIMVTMKAKVVAAGDLVVARIVDSDGLLIKQWQNNGADVTLNYATARSTSMKPLFFEIPLKAGQSVKIEHLNVQKVG